MVQQLAPEDTAPELPRIAQEQQDGRSSPSEDLNRLFRTMQNLNISADELVKKIDEDGDGELSPTELHEGLLNHLNFVMSNDEMAALMKALDQDGDGFVSMSELADTLKKWSQPTTSVPDQNAHANKHPIRSRSMYKRLAQRKFPEHVLRDGVRVCDPSHGRGVISGALAKKGKPYGVRFENGVKHAYTGHYLSHNYLSHNYLSHNYLSHNYI